MIKKVLFLLLLQGSNEEVMKMVENILWLGHASVLIKASKVIYIDPWKLKGNLPQADIVLITHDHYDHCSPDDVRKILKPDTKVFAGGECARKIKNAESVKPGDVKKVEGVKIEAVPAYNLKKDFHPKKSNFVGYIIEIEGQRIYHAGDTDFIPEMKNIKVNIALMPVGGTYTMNAEEAASAVNTFKPDVAIPIHWGDIVGSAEDAKTFEKLSKVMVHILSKFNP